MGSRISSCSVSGLIQKNSKYNNQASRMALEPKNVDKTPLKEAKLPVIWVLGGPGSGKGTQCDQIVAKYGYTHLSSGDLLRAELQSGSDRAKILDEIMIAKISGSKGYLIDGYPREVAQGQEFEKEILPCSQILYFDVSDETMTERLLGRGKTSGRADDNIDTIKLRLDTFHKHSKPVVEAYKAKCCTIPAERDPKDIFADVCAVLDKL